MAVKGAQSKEIIKTKILEVFPDAFINDKEIRIPMIEDGIEVQIKIGLTAAKENVPRNGATQIIEAEAESVSSESKNIPVEPSEEEKENLKRLVDMLF